MPFLMKEEIQIYRPLLVPMGLAIVGYVLITLALIRARQEAPEQEPEASKQEPKPEPKTARVPVRQPPKLKVIERNPLPETLVKTLTSLLEKMPRQKSRHRRSLPCICSSDAE